MDVLSLTYTPSFLKKDNPIKSTVQFKRTRHLKTSDRHSKAVKSGGLTTTHKVLGEIPLSSSYSWNKLIHTHLCNGDSQTALSVFNLMLLCHVRPDRHTIPRIITASRISANLFLGRQVHALALKLGFSTDHYVVTALIELYGRLVGVDAARFVFDKCSLKNSVSWTMLARLYLAENKPNLAIDVFTQMVEFNVDIDPVALATAIGACGQLKSVQQGRSVHEVAKKCGLESDVLVGNSLLKMYIDCGRVENARATFDRMPYKDVISWTEIIRVHVKNGGFNEGLKLFRQMITDKVQPDSLTISSVLPACARMAAHKHGKEIHGYLIRNGIDMNVTVSNAIMDMYVKSGFIESASKVFSFLEERDVVSWTVMILGFSLHGQGELGVDLFHKMEKDSSIEIDNLTYAAVLHACITACFVAEGKLYFSCIRKVNAAHYASMVSLLARARLFDEARSFIEEHKIGRIREVLRALLDGYRIHQQATLGKQVIEKLLDLEPLNAENYVLLSNWNAENASWDMADEWKKTIRDMGLNPKKAHSWIEFRNKVHVFGTGDLSHPRSEKIYSELHNLMKNMEYEGIRPNSDYSLHDVDEERECIQIGHSELLAISFGLISTQAGATIRVTKNLRVCHSCHDAAKGISKVVEREIIIKDPSCFHHFKNGACSCKDFW
ncbi:pentatricopeptide repeat-containing protein DOT4 chloroplastic-like [Tripterygium wilfordii]|uniref:Pentatricopeptide repeat-containing protein DOT4 chloroplastic-like n=1 Tax=Tripterygium wilfordii TaxID=458696 RepID=A0A7J7BXL6_TRIWF|nr:pentatricopeptide repeat-containing protein DOT4, chloroplastic-like [Tripterygium wilfordii]KAF5726611.1 pentatricopeptide repeat-containing protein DOT4 chloroplastic-like [Tripterygium wilfordii]